MSNKKQLKTCLKISCILLFDKLILIIYTLGWSNKFTFELRACHARKKNPSKFEPNRLILRKFSVFWKFEIHVSEFKLILRSRLLLGSLKRIISVNFFLIFTLPPPPDKVHKMPKKTEIHNYAPN